MILMVQLIPGANENSHVNKICNYIEQLSKLYTLKMFTSSEANTFSLDQYLNIQTKIYSRVQDAILICVLEAKGNRCVTIPIHPPFSICTTRLIYYVATVDK